MNGRVVRAIVMKDLREFPRNPYWVVIGPVALLVLIVAFWMLPDRFTEGIFWVGVSPRGAANSALTMQALAKLRTEDDGLVDGLRIVPFDSEDRLRAVVAREIEEEETKHVAVGVALPDDFYSAVKTGRKTTVRVHLDGSEDMGRIVSSAVREIAYGLRAVQDGKNPVEEFPVALPDLATLTLGEDSGTDRIPGERLRPMAAMMALYLGLIALAGLTACELEDRTVTAILVTPAGVGDFLAAKCLTGMILGSAEALVFLASTSYFETNWPVTVVLVILGAIMTSSAGMIAGAAGKGFAMTLLCCTLIMVPLMYPMGLLLHADSANLLGKCFPSYGVVKGLIGATAHGKGWSDLAPFIGMAAAWDVVLLGVGLVTLKRRVESP